MAYSRTHSNPCMRETGKTPGEKKGRERKGEREEGHVTIIEILALISTAHTRPFHGPFSGTTGVSRCQKKSSSGLYGAEDNRPDMPTIQLGANPSRLIRDPPPSSPQFYTGCPSCHNHSNLSWLGTGIKYAGLHNQWLRIQTHTHTTDLRPFSGTIRVSRCQKRTSGLYGARED